MSIVDAGNNLTVCISGDDRTECFSGVVKGNPAVDLKVASREGGRKGKDGGVAADLKRDLSNPDLNDWAGEYHLVRNCHYGNRMLLRD